MEHVVFFSAPDGTPAFRRLPSLEEAVDFVEHLRNEQNVADASVHALTEVPLAFRTVYRVEVAGAVPAPSAPAEPAAQPVAEPVAEQVVEQVAEPTAQPAAQPVAEAPAGPFVPAPVAAEAEPAAAAEPAHEEPSLGFFAR